ncbi:MAG TPA: hypothetical protein VFB46_06740 [Gemmatimonadaceae bacterium]|nr:hypothetical protein [Gemmatimonadaceae bacterium]
MKRLALVAAVLVITACKANEADTAADTTTQVAPAPAPADTMMRDTMMRDTTMRDTTRRP